MLAGLSFCAGCRIFKDSMSDLLETIKKVGSHFAVSGELIDGEELVTGLINQTFLAVYENEEGVVSKYVFCLLYTSPSPRDQRGSRMPSSA